VRDIRDFNFQHFGENQGAFFVVYTLTFFSLSSTIRLFEVSLFMKKEYIFAFVSIVLWSTMATASKILLGSQSSFQVLWASSFFAMLFMVLFNLFTGNFKKMKQYKLKDYIVMIFIGLPGTFFYYIFFYAGASILPASQAFIVNYMWPIMSVVFAWIILKEKMTVRKAVAIAVSFLGVVIVTSADMVQLNVLVILGALCCFCDAICYGVFTALNQKFHYDKPISVLFNYSTTFVLATVFNLVQGDLFIPSPLQALGFCWNGAFTMALACMTWMWALESGKTAKISNLAYITPFLSLIWTAVILKETITVNAVVGLCVIVGGIFIQMGHKRRT